jgi:hypothetical protein
MGEPLVEAPSWMLWITEQFRRQNKCLHCLQTFNIAEIEAPIKSGPVLVVENPAPILVPIPRHPTEVGADIIQSKLWLLGGANRFCDQEF